MCEMITPNLSNAATNDIDHTAHWNNTAKRFLRGTQHFSGTPKCLQKPLEHKATTDSLVQQRRPTRSLCSQPLATHSCEKSHKFYRPWRFVADGLVNINLINHRYCHCWEA